MARPIKYRKTSHYQGICFTESAQKSNIKTLDFIFCRPMETTLFSDEIEALKLRNIFNLSQSEIAKKMKISQPTVARTLKKAYKKITKAVLEGKAIRTKKIQAHSSETNKIGSLFAMQRIKD